MSGLSIGIGVGLKYNRPILGKINVGDVIPEYPEGLIARYACYDNTNDDEDRDILQDLSGNGHDVQLYNFAFTEGSGYNKSTYKGALVSDGVDDYGLCKNFPNLSIDKGFTVVAIRKWVNQYPNFNSVFLSTRTYNNGVVWGPFSIEKINVSNGIQLNYGIISYGKNNSYKLPIDDKPFVYCTSSKYNNIVLTKGNNNAQYNILNLFCGTNNGGEHSSVALYALEIYDRDLTDEEIAKVKARMIAEYEEKTGNVETNFLMEDGSYFLMENNSNFILE